MIALAIQRLHIFVFFDGSVQTLFALAAFAYLMLKWGTHMAFRGRGEPEADRPQFPIT